MNLLAQEPMCGQHSVCMQRVLDNHVKYDSYFVLTLSFLSLFISVYVVDFILHIHEQCGSHSADVQSVDASPWPINNVPVSLYRLLVELETRVESKWRDIVQVCRVPNAGGKNFLVTQSVCSPLPTIREQLQKRNERTKFV